MKNTLEQEVELLGRSVSVLLIAGLLVVGGASAALLNQFATIEGDADVTQAIQINGDEGEYELTEETVELKAGEEATIDSITVENHLEAEQELPLNDEENLGSENGVETNLYEAWTIAEGPAEVSLETVDTDEGQVTGFHVEGTQEYESGTDDQSNFGGVFYEVDGYNSVDASEVDDATVTPEFVELDGHDFQSPDWVGVVFEHNGEEYTFVTVTADEDSGDEVDVESGTYTVLDSEGDFADDDDEYGIVPSDVLDSGEEVDVQAVKLATGTSTVQDNDLETIDLLYQEATLDIDGQETVGESVEIGDSTDVTIPPTETDDADDLEYELGLGVETGLYTDGSESFDFDFRLGDSGQ